MPRRTYRPLQGVRVLSFELAYSLPAATRMLRELGAEVVKVAPPAGVGFAAYTTVVDGVSLGKPNIAINLKTTEGRALARSLVAKADVVCSNFTAPVMPSFGLGPAGSGPARSPARRAVRHTRLLQDGRFQL